MKSYKRILALMLALVMALGVSMLITSCDGDDNGDGGGGNQPCTEHTDLDGDELCDDCGADVPAAPCVHKDSDYNELCDDCGESYSVSVVFTITLLDESEVGVAGISITLYKDNVEAFTATTDAQGKVSGTVKAGEYAVNADGLPEYWYSNASYATLTINESSKDFSYTAYDNTPTGSEDNPFHAENATTGEGVSMDMPAGAEYYFTVKGISTRDLVIENASVKVKYGTTEYLPEAGVVRVRLNATSSVNEQIVFVVTNTSSETNNVTIAFESLPGSQDNPYTAVLDTETTIEVVAESSVHYKWTATATGVLVIKSETATNNISMYNTTSYVVTGYTNGGLCEYIYVTEGDVVDITVALTESAPTTEVVFTLSLCAGTAASPIPVYESASLRMLAGASYYVVYHGDNANLIIPADDFAVILNGAEQSAEGNSYVIAIAEGDVLVITNGSDSRADVDLVISK